MSNSTERMREPVLQVNDARLSYPGPPPVDALRGVDLCINPGEFVAVVGPSGAGKSSLLNVVGLLATPTSGEVIVGGLPVRVHSDAELTKLRSQRIGFVFQSFHLIEGRTTVENVVLPLRYRQIAAAKAIASAEDALRLVGLGHRLEAMARTLSGGERQRVAIARALVTEPDIILCDEPTGNLDTVNSNTVMEVLHKLNQLGRTVIVITHDEEVAAGATRVVRFRDGRIESDNGPAVELGPSAGSARSKADASNSGRSRIGILAQLDEALASLIERPVRTVLTCLGTLMGVATLVAVLGIAATATGQVSQRFDELAATTVTAQPSNPRAFDPDRLNEAAHLNGVRGIALTWIVAAAEPTPDWAHPDVAAGSLPVQAATPASWDALQPTLQWGRTFDTGMDHDRVAVLGSGAAYQLGIIGPLGNESVLINGIPYEVIGVYDDIRRQTDMLASVVIPAGTARDNWGPPPTNQNAQITIDATPGAGGQIARELPLALSPERPSAVSAVPPPNPRQLQDSVSTDLSGLFYVLAAVTLVIGMVGIANTTYVTVMERISEIGLRRALGATRAAVRRQFLTEAAIVGAIGGVLGVLVGLIVVIAASLVEGWGPVIAPQTLLYAPLAGLGSGLFAGILPARKAARVDPADAVRQ